MHELSIAQSILDIVNDQITKSKAKKVNEVELVIGTLSGIEINSLEFALEVTFNEPIYKDCKFNLIKIEAKSICNDCEKEFIHKELYSNCPNCKSYSTNLVSGKELQIKSILID